MDQETPPPLAPRTVSLSPSLYQKQKIYQKEKAWTFSRVAESILESGGNTALWSDSDESEAEIDYSQDQVSADYSRQTSDAISSQALLALLEKENASLALDPKTVLADKGRIRASSATLQSLTATFYKSLEGQEIHDPALLEFWETFLEQPQQQLTKYPHLISGKIRSAPIPTHLRAKIWMHLADTKLDRVETMYDSLLNETSDYQVIIRRDIPRTFPNVDMFKGKQGQEQLFNVLKAFSVYDRDVGYCQGLSFCVGPLLMHKMSEKEAFAVLIRLMEDKPVLDQPWHLNYGMRLLFTPEMTGLHIAIYQHSHLLEQLVPVLSHHFNEHGIIPTMYASQWFLTIFSYNFPLDLVFRIFDIMMVENVMLTMVRLSVAILKRNQRLLLECQTFESILEFTKDRLLDVYKDGDGLIKDAFDLATFITQEKLDDLKQTYWI